MGRPKIFIVRASLAVTVNNGTKNVVYGSSFGQFTGSKVAAQTRNTKQNCKTKYSMKYSFVFLLHFHPEICPSHRS